MFLKTSTKTALLCDIKTVVTCIKPYIYIYILEPFYSFLYKHFLKILINLSKSKKQKIDVVPLLSRWLLQAQVAKLMGKLTFAHYAAT